jgi:acetyl-CoA carboxylase biotin carboxyl carrier protein
MDLRKIKKLIELLEESNLAEIEVHEGEESVRLLRHQSGPVPFGHAPGPVSALSGGAMPAPASAAATSDPGGEADDAEPALPEGEIVHSPMVGTYYGRAEPGAEPYVKEGSRVAIGDTLCLVEAMKMFNTIEAEHNGVIVAVLVEDGQPVEYDQPLFVIRKA